MKKLHAKETGNIEIKSISLENVQVIDELRGRETDTHWGWAIINITYSEADGYLLWAKRPEVV